MHVDAGLTGDPNYPSVWAQEPASCTIIALFMHRSIIPGLKRYESTSARGLSSEYRPKQISRLMEAADDPITVEYLKRVVRDHAGFPLSICRHASREDPATTNAAFIADLTAQVMYVAIGNPCVAEFKAYGMRD